MKRVKVGLETRCLTNHLMHTVIIADTSVFGRLGYFSECGREEKTKERKDA